MFAKLYETEEYGQILAMYDNDGEGEGKPSVKFHVQPEGLGVCSIGPTWEDNDEGWGKQEDFFEKVDEEIAKKFAEAMWETLYG